jgi:A/G-specific adenine glycosylase
MLGRVSPFACEDRAAMTEGLAAAVMTWYADAARDLPWRRAERSPWGVLVSEVMLQQTQVNRVLPVWQEWMHRWPEPAALASEPPAAAMRAWGRLGYPRRALRLHACARAIRDEHAGQVPTSYDDIRALPGVGDYTAAALAAFAFGQRVAVLDTNVRRVYARVLDGRAAAHASVTVKERAAALALVPPEQPGRYSVAVMELGALVCTSRSPRCESCPLTSMCAWRRAGKPVAAATRPAQRYAGTDRQARGQALSLLRAADNAVHRSAFAGVGRDAAQRERALSGLVADGLVELLPGDRFRLPA